MRDFQSQRVMSFYLMRGNLPGAVVLGFDADLELLPLLECHVLDFL